MSSSRQRPVWSEIIFSTHILCFSVFTNNYKYAGVILCYITNIIKHKTKWKEQDIERHKTKWKEQGIVWNY
jgi:hypothetical protein